MLQIPSYESFVEMYPPTTPVKFGDRELTLDQALRMEALLCQGKPEARQDSSTRVQYLAGKLAASGSLLPEHQFIVQVEV